MNRIIVLLIITFHCASAQKLTKRTTQLMLSEGEIFRLDGNSFFLDSLILKDGSELILDKRHNKTTIRVNYFSFGKGCIINGYGLNGENGEDGVAEFNTKGKNGFGGHSGVNLILHASKLEMKGDLLIDLHGGNGGYGGLYGNMGFRSEQVRVGSGQTIVRRVPVSNPYPRAEGGTGGKGGELVLSYPASQDEEVHEKILITNQGGFQRNSNTVNQREPATMKRALQANGGKIKFITLKDSY